MATAVPSALSSTVISNMTSMIALIGTESVKATLAFAICQKLAALDRGGRDTTCATRVEPTLVSVKRVEGPTKPEEEPDQSMYVVTGTKVEAGGAQIDTCLTLTRSHSLEAVTADVATFHKSRRLVNVMDVVAAALD